MLWIELERHRCATPLFALSDAWTHSASVDSYRAGKGMPHDLSGTRNLSQCADVPLTTKWLRQSGSLVSASASLKDDGR